MKNLRIILRIAFIELKSLFYTPVGWLMLIVFTIQSSVVFMDSLDNVIRYRDSYWRKMNLTEFLYTNKQPNHIGFFHTIESYLFLYIPLLTMGLFSREISNGSIKLLQSSPLTSFQVVFGKFLSVMIYGLLLMIILGIQIGLSCYAITNVDIGLIISGLIGLYLLLCTYAAIGLYMSSLTRQQVIAAISTFVTLLLLNYINDVGTKITLPFGISFLLTVKVRTGQFIDGLISTKNIIYFFGISFLFLGLTELRLIRISNLKKFHVRFLSTAVWVIGCLIVIDASSSPGFIGYIDMTHNKTQTITKNTLNILKKFKQPIRIHTYIDILGEYSYLGLPKKELEDQVLFEKFQRFMPGLSNDYTFYYDEDTVKQGYYWRWDWNTQFPGNTNKEIAMKIASVNHLNFDEVYSTQQLKNKFNLGADTGQFVRELQYGKITSALRVFDVSSSYKLKSNQPSENEVANALKRLLVVPPKVIFLTGNGERDIFGKGDKGYYHATLQPDCRGSLINRGFDVDTVNLLQSDIPANNAALVIADPDTMFSVDEMEKISKYISNGGNLLITGGAGRQPIMNTLLSKLNVRLKEGELVQGGNDNPAYQTLAKFSDQSESVASSFEEFIKNNDGFVLNRASAIDYPNNGPYHVVPLLFSNKVDTWNMPTILNKDSMSVRYRPQLGDQKRNWPVALALTKSVDNRQQRILVIGDADFLTEKEMERDNVGAMRTRDLAFASEIFKWFSYGNFPVDAEHADTPNDYRIGLTGVSIVRLLMVFILPALLLISGSILLITRNRQ